MRGSLLLVIMSLTGDVNFTDDNHERRELEADLKGIASTHSEVISDDPDEETVMNISLMLTNIVDYDTKKQILYTNGYFSIQWNDNRYSWHPENYGNISTISIPCQEFVKPDVKLYNSAEDGMKVDTDVNCVITSNGQISYIPLVSLQSFCPINDPTDDTFVCHLKFGSWTHPCHDLNITRNSKNAISLEHFSSGWRWQVLANSAQVHEQLYSCCPEPYCDVEITLQIRDRSRTPRGRWYYPHCL